MYSEQRQKIHPLWARYNVFSQYQVQGAYAHLMQKENTELMEALQLDAPTQYFNDPLRLQVPYDFLAARLVKPPDCVVARVIAIMAIGALFAYPFI